MKQQVVSRSGTGSSSSSSPCSITFSFAVSCVSYLGYSTTNSSGTKQFRSMYCDGYSPASAGADVSIITTSFASAYMMRSRNSNTAMVKRSSDYKTLYWYGDEENFNYSGETYYFLGVAK